MGENYETLYVIPDQCPDKDLILATKSFGKYVIKQKIFKAIFPKSFPRKKNLEYKINHQLYVSWTCAGCTKAMGPQEFACQKRMCGLGGKLI
ncbi:MAG: hypothetical protein WC503_03100 [Candidatus Shapirobacteria bacterium]